MIKVLFVHHKLVCGGAEQALFDLVTLMNKQKFAITVFEQVEGGEWTEKFRNAGIRVISPWSCQIKSSNPVIRFQNYLKRRKIKQALLEDGKGLLSICLDEEYDIIVSYHVIKYHQIGFLEKAKTIKYIHSDMKSYPHFRKNIMDSIEEIRKFDRIICVSEAAKKSFVDETGLSDNISVRLNPINSENIRRMAQEPVIILDNLPIITAVGRLVSEKGFDRLIRIHKRIYDSGIKHKLYIIGDGKEKKHLHEVIVECHAENSVVLVGYQRNPYPYMKQSKFVVCSSFTEGLPVIAMEAIVLNVPIVSTIESVKEIFGSNCCGLITKNDDDSLESGIRKMLSDSAFYEQAKRGTKERCTYFNGKTMTECVENEFMRLIE